ncbi:MAG: hypothetical protein ACFFBP_06825 [Promethearchaeota archaeon]
MVSIVARDNILNYVKNTYYSSSIKKWSKEKLNEIIADVEVQGFTKTPPSKWTPNTRIRIEGMIKAIPLIMDMEENTQMLKKDIATECGVGIDLIRRINPILLPNLYKERFNPTGKKRYNQVTQKNRRSSLVRNALRTINKKKYPNLLNPNIINKSTSEIYEFTKDLIQHTLLSQRKILAILNNLGAELNPNTYPYEIKKIALNEIYNGNIYYYQKCFPKRQQIHESKKKEIIKLLNKNPIIPHIKISKILKVGNGTISKIAEEQFTAEEYESRWPANQKKLSVEINNAIIQRVKEKYPDSLETIASDFDISSSPVKKIAKKHNSLQEYRRKWPADQEKYFKPLKKKILSKLYQNPPVPLKEIYKEFKKYGISFIVILNLAKKNFSTEDYKERWTATRDLIPDKIRDDIKYDILYSKKFNATDISKKYGVALNTVRKIAMEEVFNGDELIYNTRFPQQKASGLGIVVHKKTNELLTAFFNSISIQFYSEVRLFPYSNMKVDGIVIKIDRIRQKASSMGIQFREDIEILMFDYTNDITEKNILKKILKYQHKKIMFFIIGMKWPSWWKNQVKEPPNEKVVKYPKNIKIISPAFFSYLIDLDGYYQRYFQNILDFNYNWDIDSLDQLHFSDILYDTTNLQQDFNFEGFFNDFEEKNRKRLFETLKKRRFQLNLDDFL